jgi:hypothetical protein
MFIVMIIMVVSFMASIVPGGGFWRYQSCMFSQMLLVFDFDAFLRSRLMRMLIVMIMVLVIMIMFFLLHFHFSRLTWVIMLVVVVIMRRTVMSIPATSKQIGQFTVCPAGMVVLVDLRIFFGFVLSAQNMRRQNLYV